MTDQLHAASRRFPDSYIMTKQGASYVEHSVVGQRLLEVFGFYDIVDIELVRGHVPAWIDKKDEKKNKPPLEDAVTGVLLTIRVHHGPAGTPPTTITEVGEVEFPHNHTTDASRAKHATSDAIKRCAMRLGIGLHLWAQGHYYLDRSMDKAAGDDGDGDAMPDAPEPEAKPVEEGSTPAPDPEPEPDDGSQDGQESDEQQEYRAALTDLLDAYPAEFVGTLDLDRMYAFAVQSRDNMNVAIDTIEAKHQQWEAEHDADEETAVPAPGFFYAKGGGHYQLYDKDGREEDSVRGSDNVPEGYAEVDQPIEQVEIVEEGNDQPARAPGDGSRTFGEELESYPEAFLDWLRDQGVSLDAMSRMAERDDELKANAVKIVANRWREYQSEQGGGS